MSPTSRRKYPRKDFTSSAIIHRGEEPIYTRVIQISEGGLMLNCEEPLDVGSEVSILFVIEFAHIRVKGEVIYQLENELGQKRMGIRFTHIEENDLNRIRIQVAKLI